MVSSADWDLDNKLRTYYLYENSVDGHGHPTRGDDQLAVNKDDNLVRHLQRLELGDKHSQRELRLLETCYNLVD